MKHALKEIARYLLLMMAAAAAAAAVGACVYAATVTESPLHKHKTSKALVRFSTITVIDCTCHVHRIYAVIRVSSTADAVSSSCSSHS